jgi:RNA polymerase sigma-70 factor (ECF subfamily)
MKRWFDRVRQSAWRVFRSAKSATGGQGVEAEEWALLERARNGGDEGRKAYHKLVERHQDWLVYFLSCLLNNRMDAEDVAQEVFVRAYLSIDRFRGDSRFKTWIRRIAINQAHNFRRGEKRYQLTDDKDDRPDASVRDTNFGALEARQALRSALDELSFDDRQLIILRYVEQMAVKDIAEDLDIGLSAAKMRLKRARDDFEHAYRSSTEGT